MSNTQPLKEQTKQTTKNNIKLLSKHNVYDNYNINQATLLKYKTTKQSTINNNQITNKTNQTNN